MLIVFQKTFKVQNKDNKTNLKLKSEAKINKFRKKVGARSKIHKIYSSSPLKMSHTFGSKLSKNQYQEEITMKFVIHSTYKMKANQLSGRHMFILVLRPKRNFSCGSS